MVGPGTWKPPYGMPTRKDSYGPNKTLVGIAGEGALILRPLMRMSRQATLIRRV